MSRTIALRLLLVVIAAEGIFFGVHTVDHLDRVGVWAVSVGTNMQGLTPAFGERIRPFVFVSDPMVAFWREVAIMLAVIVALAVAALLWTRPQSAPEQ